MPEGPEILYFSVFLKKKLTGYRFKKINSFTDKPVEIPGGWDGKILDVGCGGKLLWLYVTGKKTNYYMHIHYGITGWLTFDKPESYIKFEFILEKEHKKQDDKDNKSAKELTLYMEDKRRFSKIKICTQEEHDKIIGKLGIDMFGENFTLQNFKDIIRNKNSMVAALLLKQEIFCGIGNYIKNESMYMCKLKSKIKTSELSDEQIEKLYNDILFVGYSNLMEMLADSKLTKYLDKSKSSNMPKKLEIPYEYKIYGREKTLDGKQVYKIKVAGRDTYCTKELC
jgi:formamidopyrimidine-DNA glycosylase